jgi:HD superfamily phosphohydrolase YqeK
MDVSYSFGHIQKHTEKMVKVFNAGIHDLCKEGDAAAFVPYIREHQVSSDVDVIT